MPDKVRTARKHYVWALELWSVIQCPKIVRLRKSCAGTPRVDFSDRDREYAVDVLRLAGGVDSTGYMRLYFESDFPRAFWHEIPRVYQGRVSADIREFKKALRDGGYLVE